MQLRGHRLLTAGRIICTTTMATRDRPLPRAVIWTAVALNAALLCTEAALFVVRGLVASGDETVMVGLLIVTPVINLAFLLDYHWRGV